MKRPNAFPIRQKGSYLLETLIAILLIAFGILGLIGLHAGAIRATNDARLRSEAANIANGMIAQMWTETAAQMDLDFCSGCTKLVAWQTKAGTGLLPSGAVTVDLTAPGLSSQSRTVTVTITWRLPSGDLHNFVSTAQIGKNS